MSCPLCGQENRTGATFCDTCGAELIPSQDAARQTWDKVSAGGSFVGRQREMANLTEALEDALSGQGRLVMLVGEPGIGKTRTAQELVAYAQARGVQTLWGWCYEDEGAPPYWPWVQALRDYIRRNSPDQLCSEIGPGAAVIAEIVPDLREKLFDLEPAPSLDPEQARFRFFDSLSLFLKNIAQSRTLLLVLDDLHWADQPSLLLLQYLSRQLGRSRLLVVGCYRDVELSRQHPLSETLANLTREPVFQRILLRGLSQEQTGSFIEVMAGVQPTRRLAENIYTHTEGNPFFMAEVVRLLEERGDLLADGTGDAQRVGVPEGVREVIGQRLNRLSPGCNQVLTVASVIGREFDFKLLAALNTGVPEEQLLAVIDEALEAHLVEELPGGTERYRFSHSLVQQTLAEELSTSRKVRLHARIGEALEELYGPDTSGHAAELAYHFAEAEVLLGPEKLVRYSLIAGEQALAAYAQEEALSYFQRALSAKEALATDSETAALWFGLARAYRATFQRDECWDALYQSFEYYRKAGDVPRAVEVAKFPFMPAAAFPDLPKIITPALELLPPDSPDAAPLLATYGRFLADVRGDYAKAQEVFARSLETSRRDGDLQAQIRTLSYAASGDFYNCRWGKCLENSLEALSLSQEVNHLSSSQAHAFLAAVRALIAMGDSQAAAQYLSRWLTQSEKLHDSFFLANTYWFKGLLAYLRGEWAEARTSISSALSWRPDDVRCFGLLARLEYAVGELDRGKGCLDRFADSFQSLKVFSANYGVQHVLGIPFIAGIGEDTSVADTAAAVARDILSHSSQPSMLAIAARVTLGMGALPRGDTPEIAEAYSALSEQPGTLVWLHFTSADRALGRLAATMGSLDKADEHFENAVTFCSKAGYQPELAWSYYDWAHTLLQPPESTTTQITPSTRDKTKTLLKMSLDIANELGMRPLLSRLAEMQQLIESSVDRTRSRPDGLTRREMEVLSLMVLGKTDRDIAEELTVSVKTVSYHVGNILSKTASANRTEAAAYASQNGLV